MAQEALLEFDVTGFTTECNGASCLVSTPKLYSSTQLLIAACAASAANAVQAAEDAAAYATDQAVQAQTRRRRCCAGLAAQAALHARRL